MILKKFFGRTSKEVFTKMREELGDDAVIVTNKSVNGGFEITATTQDEMESSVATAAPVTIVEPKRQEPAVPRQKIQDVMAILTKKPVIKESNYHETVKIEPEVVRAAPVYQPEPVSAEPVHAEIKQPAYKAPETPREVFVEPVVSAHVVNPEPQKEKVLPVEQNFAYTTSFKINHSTSFIDATPKMDNVEKDVVVAKESAPTEVAQVQSPSTAMVTRDDINALFTELRTVREMVHSQTNDVAFAHITKGNVAKKALMRTMIHAGFGGGMARYIAHHMPSDMNAEQGHNWAKRIFAKNLMVEHDESTILDGGGVFALVGPTGVGKTTTIAKLAARFLIRHGASKLALVTTDAYRIGGPEQLRIYGKILGVAVHVVRDQEDLENVLSDLKDKHTVLIDTVGVSQRDRMVAQQIAMLGSQGEKIKKLLCLNATSTRETLVDVISAYRGDIHSGGIDGCILTKVDEASSIGNAIDVIIQNKLKVYFVTNGQRVPEDILIADKTWFVEKAFTYEPLLIGNRAYQENEYALLPSSSVLVNSSALEVSHA